MGGDGIRTGAGIRRERGEGGSARPGGCRGRNIAAPPAKRSPARLVAYDPDRDLCALGVQGLDVTPARIGDAGPDCGGHMTLDVAGLSPAVAPFRSGAVRGDRVARLHPVHPRA